MKRLSICLLLGLCSVGVFASGTSGASGTQKSPPSVDPFAASKTMKCVIVAIRAPDMLMLENPKTGAKTPFRLAEGIKLKAKRLEVFDGRKVLTFKDLAIGQTVKVSVVPDRHEIRTLKVIAPSRNNS